MIKKRKHLLDHAKFKANEILRQATDNAKKVGNRNRRAEKILVSSINALKSTIESQLSIVDSSEWKKFFVPQQLISKQAMMPLKEVIQEALGQTMTPYVDDESEVTRQFSPEEMVDLQQRIVESDDLSETRVMEVVPEATEEKTSEPVDIL